jgi:hypothetical protein
MYGKQGKLQVCQSPDDGDNMLICDWCQRGVHLYCHKPALTRLPEDDDWYCFECANFVHRHNLARNLFDAHKDARNRAGVTEDDMLEAIASMLEGGSPPAKANEPDGGARDENALAQAPPAATVRCILPLVLWMARLVVPHLMSMLMSRALKYVVQFATSRLRALRLCAFEMRCFSSPARRDH